MRFGDYTAGMDMHAARETLRTERDRQIRTLEDDDRKRGIQAGSQTARKDGILNIAKETKDGSPPPPPRAQIVSGAAQVLAPRDPTALNNEGYFDSSDTVLCVITLVSAVNASHSWTFPATSHLWNQLEQVAVVPHCDPPVPLHRTVVASSTHTTRTLPLLSEYVRDVMLSQTECTTCILAGPKIVPSDRVFWTVWDSSVPVDPSEQEAANLAAAESSYEPQLPTSTMAFPGELLQPAPGLVGGKTQEPTVNNANNEERSRSQMDEDDF